MKFRRFLRDNYKGYLFVLPLILGLAIFTFYPVISSLVYSFHDVDLIAPMSNFGLQNYRALFDGGNDSQLFWKSLGNTAVYTVIQVPLSMVLSYLLALLLAKPGKGIYVFRVLYYLPVLIPGVVVGLLWQDILNTQYGILNIFLRELFSTSFDSLRSENIMATFIAIQLFSVGGGMIIWIAAFKSIPGDVYEAAKIDGARSHHAFFYITLPMSTPYIFYNLVMGLIGSLQVFGNAYVLTGGTGGDGNALLFYVMNIYNYAFSSLNFGLASALSWVLFLVIGLLTLVIFRTSKWVYYGDEA